MTGDLIAEVIDAERAQIAHEIHDSLLPLIFAASAAVERQLDECESNRDQPGQQRLAQAADWLAEALRIGRQLLAQTHPPELAAESWDSAARNNIAQLVDPSSLPTIDWQVDIPAGALSAAAAAACYRIVVEAIKNAIHHGKATQLSVTATRASDEVTVSVVDNGSGFQIDQVPEDRFGLRSMQGRARLAGGSLQLQSKPGGPTKVQFSLPAQG